eukprot:m.52858 g.52858  ORF g.52858 m.52858 type:complete len:679 (-) comp16589_c0_seq1:274-2310(-)
MPPASLGGGAKPEVEVHFHHVQMFVDGTRPYEEYVLAAQRMNQLAKAGVSQMSVEEARTAWAALSPPPVPEGGFTPAGQDIVTQCIHGLGWRITGKTDIASSHGTQSYALESQDTRGVKFIVTGKADGGSAGHASKKGKKDVFSHFSSDALATFFDSHSGRQGVAVLAFEVAHGEVESIERRYRAKHPGLLVNPATPSTQTYSDDGFKILDVFAYYKGEAGSDPDHGTVIRFVQRDAKATLFLPGLEPVAADFCGTYAPAYFDHWVSNVVSRTGFLQTLNDTLDFDIKVDFNAGVVAAGEAQIESTVTGNVGAAPASLEEQLISQSQVFLPINNALSEVGHVHLFLEELGQGVQHLASRVVDLTEFIAKVNRTREITGHGFTFLKIPHSYYGRLTKDTLAAPSVAGVGIAAPVSAELAAAVIANLEGGGCLTPTGTVAGDVDRAKIVAVGSKGLDGPLAAEFAAGQAAIADAVIQARYSNLYKLIGDNLTEESYLKIVENQILVDIQNGDILYQIFTCNVLQRVAGQESPFLEFIQRVCSGKCNPDGSAKPIKPGCGGFGIRNFLTLFLSIEVTKAINDRQAAMESADAAGEALATKKIEIFTHQLNEANPILTAITDGMTAQGDAKDSLLYAKTAEAKALATAAYAAAEATLKAANAALLECSTRHSEWMRKTCATA